MAYSFSEEYQQRINLECDGRNEAEVVKFSWPGQASMMLLDSYRDCTDQREILRIFQKSSSLVDNLLWQNDGAGKRLIHPQHIEVDFVSRGISVYYDDRKFPINHDLPLYVKLEYRDTVFKVADYRLGHNSLQFAIPSLMKSRELRSHTRVQLKEGQHLSLRPTNSGKTMDIGNELHVRLVDVSTDGAGLLVSDANRNFLKNNRILWLTKLNEAELPRPILAEIVYMTTFPRARQRELKVGLKFSSQLPHTLLSTLTPAD